MPWKRQGVRTPPLEPQNKRLVATADRFEGRLAARPRRPQNRRKGRRRVRQGATHHLAKHALRPRPSLVARVQGDRRQATQAKGCQSACFQPAGRHTAQHMDFNASVFICVRHSLVIAPASLFLVFRPRNPQSKQTPMCPNSPDRRRATGDRRRADWRQWPRLRDDLSPTTRRVTPNWPFKPGAGVKRARGQTWPASGCCR